MKAGAEFTPNDDAVAELLGSAAAMSNLEVVAWTVVGALREAAPKKSGRLAQSWSARVAKDDEGRATAYVGTNSHYYHLPLYGSVTQSPNRYIDRAMARAGIKYEPLPKE